MIQWCYTIVKPSFKLSQTLFDKIIMRSRWEQMRVDGSGWGVNGSGWGVDEEWMEVDGERMRSGLGADRSG